jgi:two-component system, cell cycle response regulator
MLGKRILLVDDEPNNLAILRIFLSALGYEVFEAECGVDALNQIEAIAPDLILLDVMLPDLSGYDVAACCKEIESFKTPIIFLSAKVQKEDILRGLNQGALDYLTKPFDLEFMEKKIASVLTYTKDKLQLEQDQEGVRLKSSIDSLTGKGSVPP